MAIVHMQQINILYLIDHFHRAGGTENHLARLVTSLDRSTFNCTVVTFDFADNPCSDLIKDSGIEFLHIPVGRYYTFDALKKAVLLSRIIREKKIDIVQTFHIKSDFYGTIVARMSGITNIISSKRDTGDLKSPWHLFLNKLVSWIPRTFIVVAEEVGRVVVKKEGVASNKLLTIYNGIDRQKFNVPSDKEKQAAKSWLGFSDTDFVVGTVAWLRPEKNYQGFFDAVKKASEKIPNLKAVAVGGDGDGSQLEFFKQYVSRAGITDRVLFAGQVHDVRPFLKSFDVACLVPSGNEGFSNSIIEKMAMGLPVVVSDVGGNSEAVEDGYNGFVLSENNSGMLAKALIFLAEHPDERKEMGIRSTQRVKELFTLEGMIEAHEKLYKAIMVYR
ncbi:glycosyltransferase [Desulfopila sp. IMCC35008]|uniref:glycosyltransferase n=1 Tax=Desulfopila sp. IMCC35008 TaxID=2653858 RepID=UPI0013D7ADDF|nr:glycosyltransferase [Desulfopila sp. IMCC35008]